MRGKAAFLAPEIGIEPLRGAPPVMRMRSIPGPFEPTLGLGLFSGFYRLLCPKLVRAALPPRGIRGFGIRLRLLGGLPAARLGLAPLEIVAQRRLEALGAVFRFRV